MNISIIYHSETGNTARMAALIAEGCRKVPRANAKPMRVDAVDADFVAQSAAVIFGTPTHGGNISWQIKRFLEEIDQAALAGKLGAVFASQNWPGGGGASFAEMSLIASLLVRGMLIYSGGMSASDPPVHFGAVSHRAPDEPLYRDRCLALGENIARKAAEIFAQDAAVAEPNLAHPNNPAPSNPASEASL